MIPQFLEVDSLLHLSAETSMRVSEAGIVQSVSSILLPRNLPYQAVLAPLEMLIESLPLIRMHHLPYNTGWDWMSLPLPSLLDGDSGRRLEQFSC